MPSAGGRNSPALPHFRRDMAWFGSTSSPAGAQVTQPILLMEGSHKRTKHQAPTSREAPSTKSQARLPSDGFVAWCLKFLWCLDVGAWCFSPQHSIENAQKF